MIKLFEQSKQISNQKTRLLPHHWEAGEASRLAPVRARSSLLLLDYDGTLAPFHDDRMLAVPWPGVVDRLRELLQLPSVHLALVTGRSARELRSLLPSDLTIELWGSHGREHLSAEGVYHAENLAPHQQDALEALAQGLTQAGLAAAVERKPASLAAHWRLLTAEQRATLEQIARRIHHTQGAPAGLELLVFDGGIEMRSGAIHKGHAALAMLTRFPQAFSAYLGDDVTDEDAFAALAGRALTVLVRSQPRLSHAAFWLKPPDDLLAFLDQWIAAARQAPSPRVGA